MYLTRVYVFIFRHSSEKAGQLVVRAVALIVGIIFLIAFYIQPLYSYWDIKQDISKGNVYTVEGEVTDFETPESSFGGHNSESFTIDDIKFCYYGTEDYGYSKFLCDGGVVTGDGQTLRIIYCNDPFTDEVVICYIERLN